MDDGDTLLSQSEARVSVEVDKKMKFGGADVLLTIL
jgi:hypothetical protein